MTELKKRRIPKYQHFKPRNLARVRLDGQDIYLGEFDSPESHAEYQRVIGEWLLRQQLSPATQDSITMVELMACYLKHAAAYYVKDGKQTREFGCITEAMKRLRGCYELTQVNDFGPLALQAVREDMIAVGWSRKYINKQIGRIVRMFRWGVTQELVTAPTYEALRAVPGLRKGRTTAPEYAPVPPVSEANIAAALEHLPQTVADMVRLQRLLGCRPGEVVGIRPMDIDQTEELWIYRPDSHKMDHLERDRVIFIGPKAQSILKVYLDREPESHCFSPQDSERKRREEAHANRVTPLSCGNVPKKATGRGKRLAGTRYTVGAYRRAVHRACDKADIARWSPNQLRHSAATEIRRRYGLEAAQTVLGHANATVTEIYAERDLTLAASVAKELG